MILRGYQAEALERVRDLFREGKRRVLVIAPCGSGKTVLASEMIRSAVARGNRVVFVAHRRELISQSVDKLAGFGVHAGVMMADDPRADAAAAVQVASIQTLIRRELPPADLVVVDEAHHAVSDSFRRVLDGYPAAAIVGLTATPWRTDRLGLADLFEGHVVAATYGELMTAGSLVEYDAFAYAAPELDEVPMVAGDFHRGQLELACNTQVLVGAVVREYLEHAGGRRALLFASGVAHSQALVAEMQCAGIDAVHIDYKTPTEERDRALLKFGAGEIRVVSSVGILCLDEQTEILTSKGWVGIDDMTVEHEVANWDNGNVFFARPEEVVRRERLPGERMVQVNGRRMSLRVTEGHRMLYRWSSEGRVPFRKKAARDLVGAQVAIPVSGIAPPGKQQTTQPSQAEGRARRRAITANAYCLRKNNGLDFEASVAEATARYDRRSALRRKPPQDLSVDECAFIGFWIGDGSRSELQRGGLEYFIVQSARYSKIIAWLDDLFSRLPYDVRRRTASARPEAGVPNDVVRWSFARGTGGGSQERSGLFAIEPYLDKNGSELFWALNEEQFAALLRGWWLADGEHGDGFSLPEGHHLRIASSNRRLIDLMQAIACVRGYRASITLGTNHIRGYKTLFKLAVNRVEQIILEGARMEFDPEPWRPERVWCVKTQTRNIITRRRGRVAVMGNTEGFDQPAAEVAILARPTKSLSLHIQMLGRILRPAPGKARALVHDHAGNLLRLGLVEDERDYAPTATPARVKSLHTCPLCHAIFGAIRQGCCPKCGELIAPPPEEKKNAARKAKRVVTGERVDIDEIRRRRAAAGARTDLTPRDFERLGTASSYQKKAEFLRLTTMAREKGWSRMWPWKAYFDTFGEQPHFSEAELSYVKPAKFPFLPWKRRKSA